MDKLCAAFHFACGLGDKVKKTHSKIVYASLAILISLSPCKVTEMHPLRIITCLEKYPSIVTFEGYENFVNI